MIDRNATIAGRALHAASPIFAALIPETAARLAERAETKRLSAGELLFDQEEQPERLFILVSGRGILTGRFGKKAETVVAFVKPGDAPAISAVVLDVPFPVAARMSEASSLIAIPAPIVRECLFTDAAFAVSVAAALSSELHGFIGDNVDLKLRTASQRLAAYLLALCGGKNGSVLLHHERRLLAGRLGMTPESLSRAFAQLDLLGVHGRGHDIHITDAKKLREFSVAIGNEAAFSSNTLRVASSGMPRGDPDPSLMQIKGNAK